MQGHCGLARFSLGSRVPRKFVRGHIVSGRPVTPLLLVCEFVAAFSLPLFNYNERYFCKKPAKLLPVGNFTAQKLWQLLIQSAGK